MFNPTEIVIQAFVEHLRNMYGQIYGVLEPAYPDIIGFVGRLALENIADSDAAYHDMNHTIMVTLVGQEILRGKHTRDGGVTPRDWLHFTISLLCHDIGYVRGVCRGDRDGQYVCSETGDLVGVSAGATDASLTPYHVTRSKLFVRERFGKASLTHIDTREIEANIEHTRFPVPEHEQHANTADYPGLLRAADLIGQLADINYLRKTSALFAEFRETGASQKLEYETADDLRAAYPAFFWNAVRPYIGDALRYLRVTQEGKQWIANLYAHVFSEEHRGEFGAH
ncbi:Npun_R2479 family HD domain-containing metalloprotein [Bradyrhizobium sp. URHC0002]